MLTDEERKSRKAVYNKRYRDKNKEKIKAYKKVYDENNKDKIDAYNKTIHLSEGLGVYKATYPSGVYVGSGKIYDRKNQHLRGNSGIARTLGEKATSFEILFLTDTKEESIIKESEVIEQVGLENLLNTNKS